MAVKRRDPAAVALGRKGGKKGGPARAAKLTPEQRSESARRAVQARWAKRATMHSKNLGESRKQVKEAAPAAVSASDNALLALLKRLKTTNDLTEIQQLSNQIERAIFHKQYKSA